MSAQSILWSCLSCLITLIIGLVVFLVVKHNLRVRSLPPGPFAYPGIGNILEFRGKDVFFQNVLRNIGKKFKDMYTFWMGPSPVIIVMSWDRCKEALVTRKSDFSGRVYRVSAEAFVSNGVGVISSDYGPCWETLKRVMVSAVRKYAVSDKLADLVTDVVDKTVDKTAKDGELVEAENYAYLIVYNILASSAFGQRYEMDDPEFFALRRGSEQLMEEFKKGNPSDALPILKWFYRKRLQKFKELYDAYHGIFVEKFQQNKITYQKGVVRHFIDALLLARDEAEEEGKECSQYLTDQNLEKVVNDFFAAGTLTTKTTLLWMILIMCTQLDIQEKMIAEIDEKIGSRPPTQEDKRNCHYIIAVIFETLRYRPMIDLTMEHRAVCNTKLGEYSIPKDTSCMFHILNSHVDETLWEEPELFKPERFLDSEGKFVNIRMDGFMAFGLGPRECAGKKLALADVFFIITRLLQTATIELENGPGSVQLTPEPQNFLNLPYKFNLVVKKRIVGHGQKR